MDIVIPDIGDFDKVPVIEVLVAVGDEVAAEDPLIVLESDKATMEVPAPSAGVISSLSVKVGDDVGQGDVIGVLELSAATAAPAVAEAEPATAPAASAEPETAAQPEPAPASPPPTPAPASTLPATPSSNNPAELPHASPSVRLFARELGVELRKVQGSGPKGRIRREDVQAYVKSALASGGAGSSTGLPAAPQVDYAKFGPIETVPLARIRKLSAAHLHRCWLNVPHVTQNESADITALEEFRKAENTRGHSAKLTLLPFVMKACAVLLRRFPDFNSAMAPDGESLIRRDYVHIGFAADTENGLVVPVIRDVDQKPVLTLAAECAELAGKARDGKLSPAQMQGGCFSISSLGGIGGSHFTPIVNSPEVAILGVSRARMEPVWDGQAFNPRLMAPLSLSYDHRVIDGAAAARFASQLAELLADLRRLLL